MRQQTMVVPPPLDPQLPIDIQDALCTAWLLVVQVISSTSLVAKGPDVVGGGDVARLGEEHARATERQEAEGAPAIGDALDLHRRRAGGVRWLDALVLHRAQAAGAGACPRTAPFIAVSTWPTPMEVEDRARARAIVEVEGAGDDRAQMRGRDIGAQGHRLARRGDRQIVEAVGLIGIADGPGPGHHHRGGARGECPVLVGQGEVAADGDRRCAGLQAAAGLDHEVSARAHRQIVGHLQRPAAHHREGIGHGDGAVERAGAVDHQVVELVRHRGPEWPDAIVDRHRRGGSGRWPRGPTPPTPQPSSWRTAGSPGRFRW